MDPEAQPEAALSPRAGRLRLAIEVACALLLALLLLILLATALLRHSGFSAPWIYEATRLLFVYLIGLAAIVAFARRTNLYVPAWWKDRSRSYQAALLVLAGVLAFLAVRLLVTQGFGPDASSLLGVPEGVTHVPIALFGAGVVLVAGARLAARLRGRA